MKKYHFIKPLVLLVALLLFSVSGCGYKSAPYYEKAVPSGDENIQFIIKKEKKEVE